MPRLTLEAGEWWFAMVGAEEEPMGFAHLVASEREGGGFAYHWTLKLAFPGGAYEEERTLVLDDGWRLVSATMKDGNGTMVEGRREADGWVGTVRTPGRDEARPMRAVLPDDAVTGMGFVLAMGLPQKAGVVLRRTEVNAPRGFEVQGEMSIEAKGAETVERDGKTRAVFRFDRVAHDGKRMPIWVDADGNLERIDWGGGTSMRRSETSTRHLFPESPFSEIPGGPGTLVVRGEFPAIGSARMFELWTKADELPRWWPTKAEVEPKVGGRYRLSWPEMNWTLLGEIREFEPGKRLAFTWKWGHEPEEKAPLVVAVEFAPREGGGTVLTITHGPYAADPAARRERDGHRKGWEHLGRQLAGLKAD